jgi:hypothetical protein
MAASAASDPMLSVDERLNRLALAVAVIATEMDARDDELAAVGYARAPEEPRMSLEEQIERVLYAENYSWTAVPEGGLWRGGAGG